MQKFRIAYVKGFPDGEPRFVYFDTKEEAMAALHALHTKGTFQTKSKPVPGLRNLAFLEEYHKSSDYWAFVE